jgi:hypothetical protein
MNANGVCRGFAPMHADQKQILPKIGVDLRESAAGFSLSAFIRVHLRFL